MTMLRHATSYDRIGHGYAALRRPAPRIAAAIHAALGSAATVVNIGAGAYEPDDRWVLAIEPSAVMVAQRPPGSAPALLASAEALPLADKTVEAAMATVTLHHWRDWRAGVAEMRRVAAEGIVNFTWDPESDGYWLTRDYLPWLREWDASRFPTISQLRSALPRAAAEPIPIPDDCADAFLAAHWTRPEAYLDPLVQRSNSAFAHAPDAERLTTAFERPADDLRTGAWDARHRHLRRQPTLDAGYRLVSAPAQRATDLPGEPRRFPTERMNTTTTLLEEVLPESVVNVFSGWLRRGVLDRIARFAEGSA